MTDTTQIMIVELDEDAKTYIYFETPAHFARLLHNGERSMANHVEADWPNECLIAAMLNPGEWTSLLINE